MSPTSMLARGSVRWLSAVVCALVLADPARAEAPPSPAAALNQAPSSELEPPRLLDAAEVPYPQGASGDASVILELLIERDGTVAAARVESGAEPFASAAQLAAARFRFVPARRAGTPVAARIRLELRFTEPELEQAATEQAVEAEASPEASRVPGSVVKPAPPPVEIVVQGDERPAARRSFSRAEVRQLPGAFGDPFRAIEAMPGVTPIVSGFPFFYVRGAPPGNIGYFFDGIRVPYLYHFGLGPGVIHPSMIERVDLYAGGYPARYGRYAGAVVAGEMSKPYGELRGEASVRLIDAGAMLEAPFAEGRGTAALAGRYSYTAALLSLFADDVVLDYWDYQGRATYQLGARDQLTLFGFGAYDYLGEVDQDDGRVETLAGTEFHRLDLRLDRQISKGSALRLAVTLGLDRTRSGSDGDEEFSVVDRSIGARVELRSQLAQRARLVAGLDFALDAFELNLDGASDDDVNIGLWEQDDFATGLHAEVQLEAAPRIELTPGVRVDVYTSGSARALAVEPRISAKFSITPKLRLIHTLGVAHQPPGFVVPVPGFRIAGLRGGLQRSWQESAGLEADLPERISLSLTLFQNVAFNLADPLTALKTLDEEESDPPPSEPPTDIIEPEPPEERSEPTRLETRALGHSVGFELLLKRRLTEKLGGFLAYTLSRSARAFERVSAMSGWDRTHVLSLALAYDLGRRWRAGTRVTYYTGIPATVETPELQSQSPRTDAFYRIDARLEKKWLLGSRGAWIALLIEMLNATLREEEVERRCDDFGCTSERVGPIAVPSLGVEAQF